MGSHHQCIYLLHKANGPLEKGKLVRRHRVAIECITSLRTFRTSSSKSVRTLRSIFRFSFPQILGCSKSRMYSPKLRSATSRSGRLLGGGLSSNDKSSSLILPLMICLIWSSISRSRRNGSDNTWNRKLKSLEVTIPAYPPITLSDQNISMIHDNWDAVE